MTENVEILISSKLDDNGLNQLRKGLNDSRNDLNALARATEKGSAEWKNYKATVQELNRIMKLSDADLKRYSASVVDVSNAKTKLMTSTDKLGRSFTTLKTNVAGYSSTLVSMTGDIVKGDRTMTDSIGTLALYAGGWGAVGYAIYEVTKQVIQNQEAIQQWRLNLQNRTFEEEQAMLPSHLRQNRDGTDRNKPEGSWTEFLTPEDIDRINAQSGLIPNIPSQNPLDKIIKPSKLGGNSAIKDKVEKEIKMLSDNFIGFSLWQANQSVQAMLPDSAFKVNGSAVGLGELNTFAGSFRDPIQPIENQLNLNQTLDDVNTIYGSVSSTMSLLNVSTDSFVSKIITGFDSVLTIMQTIKTINSVFSFIPFLAEGGHFSGNTPIVVGERGPELLFPSQPGYVMNNSDSMRFASNPTINNQLYLNANVDIQASMSKQNKRYNYITVKR